MEAPAEQEKLARQSSPGEDEFGRTQSVSNWQKLDFGKLTLDQKEACHILLRQGDIDWFLHPEQVRLLKWIDEHDEDLLTICISRQFGKSFMLLSYCIAFCIRHPRVEVLYIAPSIKRVGEITIPRVANVFAYLPEDHVPHRRGFTWTFPNGSVFHIDGVNLQGGARLRGGVTPNLVVIDECREIPLLQDVIESAITPMVATTNGKIILISTPPESPLHSFTAKYIADALINGTFYTATFRENPLLSNKFIKRLYQQYKGGEANYIFRREYLADYSITDEDKRVVREWDEEENDSWLTTYKGPFGNDAKPIVVRPYTLLDYAHTDPCGLLLAYYDWNQGALIVVGEHFERAMNTDDVGKKIIQLEELYYGPLPRKSETARISDLNPTLMADLRSRFGLKFRPCPKIPNDSMMLNRLRVAIVEGRVRVNKACVQLRHQLRCGVFNKQKTDYLRTDAGGHLDLLDALKYGCLAVNWNEALHSAAALPLQQGQIVIGPVNPFANNSFSGGVINRPIR